MGRPITVLAAAIFFLGAMSVSDARAARQSPIIKVVRECSASVVNISTEQIVTVQQHPYWNAYGSAFNEFYNQYAQKAVSTMKLKGIGSGVIVSKDGLIITNLHVVKMASKIYVILSDGSTAEATMPAFSKDDDLAILKVPASKDLKPVKFADDVIVGETVVSIGNAFGLENSVSAGIVSGTNRGFTLPDGFSYRGLIQTDSPINIGSSGGALLNLDGQLAGINLAVVQGAQSIGFAIPASRVKDILKQYNAYLMKAKLAAAAAAR